MYIPVVRNFVDGTTRRKTPDSCPDEFEYAPAKPSFEEQVWLEPNEVVVHKSPSDKESFSRIKREGRIKMTPYSNSRIQREYFTSTVTHYSSALGWPHCVLTGETTGQVRAVSRWDVVRTYHSPLELLPLSGEAPDIAGELNQLMSNVTTANLATYDLLTELVEMRSTIGTIMEILRAVRRPLKAFKALAENYKGLPNGERKTADLWLQYRYAIMPMMYSIRDIAELYKNKADIYKTDRSNRTITDYRESAMPNENGEYLFARYRATHRLSAVGKARYRPSDMLSRLMDQIQINPFVTAWELVPFSFVVDWFANIGDWVLAQTALVNDSALERAFCHSVRSSVVYEVFHVANLDFSAKRVYDGVLSGTVSVDLRSKANNLVFRETVESYDRNLFNPRDVQLQIDVFLNWKRGLDAFALSQKPLIKALRSLK